MTLFAHDAKKKMLSLEPFQDNTEDAVSRKMSSLLPFRDDNDDDMTVSVDNSASLQKKMSSLPPSIQADATSEISSSMAFRRITDSLSVPYAIGDGLVDSKNTKSPPKPMGMLLGEGAVGKVYKGTLKDGTNVAIKFVLQVAGLTTEKELEQEVTSLQYLQPKCGEYVPQMYEAFWFNETFVMIMELAKGERLLDLHEALQSNTQNARMVAQKLISGLKCIHTAGLLHRDIKPDNITVDTNDVKYIDFGLSCYLKAVASVGVSCDVLGGGSRAKMYWSPEIWEDQYKVRTKADDIYALGLTLLEMLIGNLPHMAERSDYRKLKVMKSYSEDDADYSLFEPEDENEKVMRDWIRQMLTFNPASRSLPHTKRLSTTPLLPPVLSERFKSSTPKAPAACDQIESRDDCDEAIDCDWNTEANVCERDLTMGELAAKMRVANKRSPSSSPVLRVIKPVKSAASKSKRVATMQQLSRKQLVDQCRAYNARCQLKAKQPGYRATAGLKIAELRALDCAATTECPEKLVKAVKAAKVAVRKISSVVEQLEDIVEQSPDTSEAEEAEALIKELSKSEESLRKSIRKSEEEQSVSVDSVDDEVEASVIDSEEAADILGVLAQARKAHDNLKDTRKEFAKRNKACDKHFVALLIADGKPKGASKEFVKEALPQLRGFFAEKYNKTKDEYYNIDSLQDCTSKLEDYVRILAAI